MNYGLGNIVDNAVDFARSKVTITALWTESTVILTIADDGPGFTPEVLMRAGDPYLSRSHAKESRAGGGLGLGLFIAKTLLERSGAALEFSNLPLPASGAAIRIVWLRSVFEADPRGRGTTKPEATALHGVS
jgi:two-component system sensor histidine kinase RegB